MNAEANTDTDQPCEKAAADFMACEECARAYPDTDTANQCQYGTGIMAAIPNEAMLEPQGVA